DLEDLGVHDILRDQWIVVHPALQLRQRGVVRKDPAAGIGLKAADQQEDAVIEAALDPRLVAFHELTGLAFVSGESEQYDKHPVLSYWRLTRPPSLSPKLRRPLPAYEFSQSHIALTSWRMNLSS